MDISRGQNKNSGLALTDMAGKQALATVFGEAISGMRTDDVSVQFQYNNSTNDLDIQTPTGTGGQSNAKSMMRVTSGSGIGSQIVFSKDAIRYRPGHEAYAQYTARFVGARIGVRHLIGIGNDDDSVCFGTKDSVFGSWFQEGGNARIFTPQTSFNVDTLDGTGGENNESGFKIDITKENIFMPTYGWLGSAPIFWMIYGGATLGWIVAHIQDDVNTLEEPHLQNPSLPMACETTCTSGTGETFIETSSWRAGSVAGIEVHNASTRRFGAVVLDIDATQATTGDATHLISVKSKAAFQSHDNHVKVIIDFINSVNTVNKDVIFEAYATSDLEGLNGSFVPGFVDINSANSVMQIGKSQDAAAINLETTGLIPLDIGLISANSSRVNDKVKGFSIHAGDEITFVIAKPATGTGDVSLQLGWDELF